MGEPPCNICPMAKTRLSEKNQVYWTIWEKLSLLDRETGMGLGTINSTAILRVLKAYGFEDTESYEIISHIESRMYPFLVEQQKKHQEQQRNKN